MSEFSDGLVADLDQALATDGQTVTIQRLFLGAGGVQIPVSVDCKAAVRPYGAKELVGGITQDQSEVIMSPTQIIAAGWPGPWTPSSVEPTQPATDRRVPRKGDNCVIAGKPRNIEIAKPIYVDDALVRIELRVLG